MFLKYFNELREQNNNNNNNNLNENNQVFLKIAKDVNNLKDRELKEKLLYEINRLFKPLIDLGDVTVNKKFFIVKKQTPFKHIKFHGSSDEDYFTVSPDGDNIIRFIKIYTKTKRVEFGFSTYEHYPWQIAGYTNPPLMGIISIQEMPRVILNYTKWFRDNIKKGLFEQG